MKNLQSDMSILSILNSHDQRHIFLLFIIFWALNNIFTLREWLKITRNPLSIEYNLVLAFYIIYWFCPLFRNKVQFPFHFEPWRFSHLTKAKKHYPTSDGRYLCFCYESYWIMVTINTITYNNDRIQRNLWVDWKQGYGKFCKSRTCK